MLLVQSGCVALGSTLVAMALGIPVGLTLHLHRGWTREIFAACAVATLALPAFLVAGVWMEWVGFAGAWRQGSGVWLERVLPIFYSSLVLGSLLWPVTAFFLAGAWSRMDTRLVDSMPELRGWAYARHLLLPQAATAWIAPATITLTLAFANFAVPALFQARVWPAEVWIEYSTRFDVGAALGKSLVPAIVMLALVGMAVRKLPQWNVAPRSAGCAAGRDRMGRPFRVGLAVLAAGVVLATLVFPMAATLFDPRTWKELVPAAEASLPTLQRSVVYAAASSTLACLAGLAVSRWRWGAVTAVPFVLPGVFAGLLLAQSTTWPGGDLWQGTAAPVLVALGLRYAFVGWFAGERLWKSANPRLLETLRLDGAGPWASWRHGVLPHAAGTLVAAWLVVYVLALWDVETVILVVPPGGDTLALQIFNLLHYGHNAQVGALCLLLGVLAVLPLAALAIINLWRARSIRASSGTAVLSALALLLMVGTGCQPKTEARHVDLDSRLFERVEVIGGKGTGPGFFAKPRSVAVDGADNLYVVDMTGRVQKFDPSGHWLLMWQMPETDRGKAKGMCTAPDGGLLVVEPHYHRVNHFSPEGKLLGQWGVHGTNVGELWFPRAVATTAAGKCLVTEYGVVERIQRFRASDGSWLAAFGSAGTEPGLLNRAEGLGLDTQGRVFVADSCNHRVQVFGPDGRFVRIHGRAGQGQGEFSYPYDVRVDRAGRQFVCEFGNSRVQVLDADDRFIEMLGGPGDGPDRMNNPWGICLDSSENLYVADALNHRVLKFVRRRGAHAALDMGRRSTQRNAPPGG